MPIFLLIPKKGQIKPVITKNFPDNRTIKNFNNYYIKIRQQAQPLYLY
ncbi:hypothetical protein SALWKB12_1454 [Snodgrassella communis]|nr:hypothetical protein SALWKB12_1454 [Snodgrassella communis]